jgi:hypothetical protein
MSYPIWLYALLDRFKALFTERKCSISVSNKSGPDPVSDAFLVDAH